MKTTAVAALVGAVVGALVMFLAGSLGNPKKTVTATILLYRQDAGCGAKVFPEVITAERNFDLDWTVADICGDGSTEPISVNWIDHPDSDPSVGNDPLESPGSDRKRFKRALKSGVRAGDKFRYEVRRGGAVLADPDVEIVF